MRLALDLTHTSHTHAQTGIQRVCRQLRYELAQLVELTPVVYDFFCNHWRPLDCEETVLAQVPPPAGPARRRGSWSRRQRWRGKWQRLRRRPAPFGADAFDALLVPEIFPARNDPAYAIARRHLCGPILGVFHDAVALRYPSLAPRGTVARFPTYLHTLRSFDALAAVSQASCDELRGYWQALRQPAPPIEAIPLGTEPRRELQPPQTLAGEPTVLCVGTIEGRKNHRALLEACESLWEHGVRFRLELIGGSVGETAGPALAMLDRLVAAGRPLVWHGKVDEAALRAAYERCAFTIYPSLWEGFGMPVLESLRAGKPCLTTPFGALPESAQGGGCFLLTGDASEEIAAGLRKVLRSPDLYARLCDEAQARPLRTWTDYARDLLAWAERQLANVNAAASRPES